MSLMVASGSLLAPGTAGSAPVMLPISVQPKVRLAAAPPCSVSAACTSNGAVAVSGSGGTLAVAGGKRRDSGDSELRSHYSSSSGSSDEHAANKIFVGGISFQTTADKLRGYFAPYGTILDVMVLKDPNTNRNRGFGFVTFADVESVHKVLAQDDHSLDGKKIDPKLATPKGQKSSSATPLSAGGMLLAGYGGDMMGMPRKVFVGGVSQETGAQELLDYFTQFGPVLECNLQMDNNTKRHRGFAFVTFEHEEHSARVVRKHHHVVKNKTVECKYAQPKETIQASERAKRAHLLTMMQTAAVANPLAAAVANPLAAAAHVQHVQQHYSRVMSGPAGSGVAPGCGPAFSGLASFRYAPYTVPAMTAAAAAVAAAAANSQLAGSTPVTSAGPGAPPLGHLTALPAGLSALQATTAPGAAGAPAGSLTAPATAAPYQLANFDISGLQGLEWGGAPIYGMYTA